MYHFTLRTIKEAHAQYGGHFFDKSAMRFFKSRVLPTVYGGKYFITSEKFEDHRGNSEPRMFTIREARPSGAVNAVGAFQQHATKARAVAEIKRLLREEAIVANQAVANV